jgi:P2-related tail formation protein
MQDISHLSALPVTLGQYWHVRDIQCDKNFIPILAQGRKLA